MHSEMAKDDISAWSLGYGGTFQYKKSDLHLTDTNVTSAVTYALAYITSRSPQSISDVKFENGTLKNAVLSEITQRYLKFSSDDEHLAEPHREFGSIIDFDLQCDVDGIPTIHHLCISQYPKDTYHIYTHIHRPVNYATQGPDYDQSKVSCGKDSISVMTYNIWNMNSVSKLQSDYVKRIQHLGQVVLDAGPDVVCFQEVRYEHSKGGQLGPNQVKHLADMLQDYQFVYVPAQLQGNSLKEGRTEEGLAVFSRFPILSFDHILLTRDKNNHSDGHQRILLHVVIRHPFIGKINILDTHLSLSSQARRTSVCEIWKYIQKLEGPLVLVGDMNASPHEDSIRFLRGETSFNEMMTKDLIDVWLTKHDESPDGYTYDGLLTKEERKERIDYIYSKSKIMEIAEIQIIDEGKIGLDAASDHLPVVARFCVKS